MGTGEVSDLNYLTSSRVSQLPLGSSVVKLCEKLAANAVRQGLSEGRILPPFSSNFLSVPRKPPWRTSHLLKQEDPAVDVLVELDVNRLEDAVSGRPRSKHIVRSATDSDLSKVTDRRLPGPCNLYDIAEFPADSDGLRSVSVSLLPPPLISEEPPDDCKTRLLPKSSTAEPLLLVGPELVWEGHPVRKPSNRAKKRRSQQMTPREMNKITRTVVGYTLLFFLLVIFTFYIVYFF